LAACRTESEASRFHVDGLLVVEDGRIADFGAHDEVAARHAGLVVTTISDRLILPGFIDGHVHFPQTRARRVRRASAAMPQKWVIPEEIKFKDRAYAREAARRFFDNLLASVDEAARRNTRLIAGLTIATASG
jgi:guanine deaminase